MSAGAEAKPSGGRSLFWLMYAQIAAMLGAFSFVVFLRNYVDLGLRGVIEQAVDGWVRVVRLLVGLPLQAIADLLPEAWRFHVPVVATDYLAVGILMVFSAVRVFGRPPVGGAVLTLFLWPVVLGAALLRMAETAEKRREITVMLTPFIYLGLLFAANAWLT